MSGGRGIVTQPGDQTPGAGSVAAGKEGVSENQGAACWLVREEYGKGK
jgi:hypothetical protein